MHNFNVKLYLQFIIILFQDQQSMAASGEQNQNKSLFNNGQQLTVPDQNQYMFNNGTLTNETQPIHYQQIDYGNANSNSSHGNINQNRYSNMEHSNDSFSNSESLSYSNMPTPESSSSGYGSPYFNGLGEMVNCESSVSSPLNINLNISDPIPKNNLTPDDKKVNNRISNNAASRKYRANKRKEKESALADAQDAEKMNLLLKDKVDKLVTLKKGYNELYIWLINQEIHPNAKQYLQKNWESMPSVVE